MYERLLTMPKRLPLVLMFPHTRDKLLKPCMITSRNMKPRLLLHKTKITAHMEMRVNGRLLLYKRKSERTNVKWAKTGKLLY